MLVVGGVAGGCAYDPAEVAKAVEPQARTLPDEIGSDLVVSERLVLKSSPGKIRRLILMDGAVLSTNGQALRIDAEEVISTNGIIDTTPSDPSLATGASGVAGGLLHLKAKRGRGNLLIVAGGQNGAPGVKGLKGDTGTKGGRGNNGEADYTTECWLLALSRVEREPGGPGRCHKNWYCSRQTGNGAPGARGGTGKPGLPGGNGGDSSPVLLELEDPSGLLVTAEVRPGKAGDGGQGGDGGLGGPGGDAGRRDSRNLCRVASGGSQGPQGSQGTFGAAGKDGSQQPLCLRLGAAQVGDCRDFEELTR